MKSALFSFFLICLVGFRVLAQSDCQNIDFESGDLDQWSSQGQIKVVNRSQKDEFGHFPLATSGFFAVKLGTVEASLPSTITRSIQIDQSTKYFIYSYAVVLLGMDHTEQEAARVELKITNTNGEIIPCTNFVAIARPSVSDGFMESDSIYDNMHVFYKPWTTNAIDLSPYIGQTLNFEITNRWCIYDVHFGYSYIDAYCTSQLINTYVSCEDQKHYIRSIEGFEEYFWNGPGIVSGDGTNTIEVNQPGSYTVGIPNTDPACDSVHLEIDVTLNEGQDKPEIDFTWASFCLGDTTFLYGQTATFSPIENQLWIINGDTVENVTEQFILNSQEPYTITCIVTNASGCSSSLTKNLAARQAPALDLGESQNLCMGEPQKLFNLAGSGSQLTWNTGYTGPFLMADAPGVYSVVAYDGYCENRDSVEVGAGNESLGPIPNIITPNDDQLNDEFIIKSTGLKDYHLIISNRWGNPVFDMDTPDIYWDGRSKGELVEDGTYYYILNYVCGGQENKKSGFVQVQK